jgi:adenylate cyclase
MPTSHDIQHLWRSLGRLPSCYVTWGLAGLLGLWAVVDVSFMHLSSGLAASTYDAMVRARFHTLAPDPRVIIVDIDEASLVRMGKEFGQWPWSRETLATVLDHLERQAPAAILWDVVFSDADKLNPGGDAAFDRAAAHSLHSHFSVVRLPTENDAKSLVNRATLPGLWLPARVSDPTPANTSQVSTVALIPPTLPALAASRLGYNNAYVDDDGVLRHFRYAERLQDGSAIQSIALSVLTDVAPQAYRDITTSAHENGYQSRELIAWRAKADSYPRVPIADVFAQAEGGQPSRALPSFAGKVILIGASAPGLHDVHPTALAPAHLGVDALATVVDNALNQHRLTTLSPWLQVLLAGALFVALTRWVSKHSVASLAPVTVVVPALLLAVSYLSLNLLPLFIDLYLAAGFGLLMLTSLRLWSERRRDYWCHLPEQLQSGTVQLCLLAGHAPWDAAALEHLMDALQRHAPSCRLVLPEGDVKWPAKRHYPALAQVVAVVGPAELLSHVHEHLLQELAPWLNGHSRVLSCPAHQLMAHVLAAWAWMFSQAAPFNPTHSFSSAP